MKIRIFLALTSLILSIGVGNSFKNPQFLSDHNDNDRQSTEVGQQSLPFFGLTFIATLILNLFIGFNDNDKVIWPMKPSPLPEFSKHATVFGIPIFATSDYSVRQKLFH